MNVAEDLRAARLRAGLTQADLAARTGTSQATLSAYENGRKDPSVATLSRLLAATGARLAVEPAGRPVRRPSRREHARSAEELRDVLGLAAALPSSHEPDLRYPRLRPRRRARR